MKEATELEVITLMAVIDSASKDLGLGGIDELTDMLPEVEAIIGKPREDENGKRLRAPIESLTPLQAFMFGLTMGSTYRGRMDRELGSSAVKQEINALFNMPKWKG